MNTALPRISRRSSRWLILAPLAVACSSDATCLLLPCPLPEAAQISVSSPNAPAGVAGLTMTISGAETGSGPCSPGTGGASVCYITGGPGTYAVALSAPGYQPDTVRFTATGTSAGCNTCGHVDTQQISVVLTPTT